LCFSNNEEHGGILISNDNGATWSKKVHLKGHPDPRCIEIAGTNKDILILGTVSSGIYRSTDKGRTWDASNQGLDNLRVQCLSVDPFLPDTIYAGTLVSLCKSEDAGQTWFSLTQNIQSESTLYIDLKASPNQKGTFFSIIRTKKGTAQLLTSNDYCKTWTKIMVGLQKDVQPRCIEIHPDKPHTLFIGTVFDGIYKSDNNGKSWESMNKNLPVSRVKMTIHTLRYAKSHPPVLYAGSDVDGAVWEYIF
jgi:photosystem II stability/assembly factor-like uncharacterized protein